MKNKSSSAGCQHGGCVCDDAGASSGDIDRGRLSAVVTRPRSACRQHAVSALQHGHAGAAVHESPRESPTCTSYPHTLMSTCGVPTMAFQQWTAACIHRCPGGSSPPVSAVTVSILCIEILILRNPEGVVRVSVDTCWLTFFGLLLM